MKRKNLVIIIPLLILAGVYLAGYLYFNNHFFPNTKINKVDVSLNDVTGANEKLKNQIPNIQVKQKGSVEQVDLVNLDSSISYDTSDLLSRQNNLSWFLSFFNEYEYDCNKISGDYKEESLSRLIDDLYCQKEENIRMPKDATLVINDGVIEIESEDDGSYIKKEVVMESFKEKLDEYFKGTDHNVLDLTDKYETSNIKKDDSSLINRKNTFEKYLSKTITINIDNSRQEVLKGTDLTNMYRIENNGLIYDEEKIDNYVSTITKSYNVSSYNYIDRSGFKNDLISSLGSNNDSSINLKWVQETRRLIEVNISEQTLYYYENGTLVLSSPVVTGNAAITDATPTGKFTVTRLVTDTNLRGADYVEHVDYWIGFDETGRVYGFHDASWRDEFGGDIYLSDPSRGCVNMPLSKISVLFGYITLGTEVYIH